MVSTAAAGHCRRFHWLWLCILLKICHVVVGEEEYVVGVDGTSEKEKDVCKDENEQCHEWAAMDECNANPRFMHLFCRKSCGVCHTDRESMLPPGTNVAETEWGVAQLVENDKTQEVVDKMDKYMRDTVFSEDYKFKSVQSICRNRHHRCAEWASLGECDKNAGYMRESCGPACGSCEHLSFEYRCPFDPDAPTSWTRGSVNQFFTNLTTDALYKKYEPVVHSRPAELSTSDTEDSIPDGPWVVTLENFLTEEECDRLIELGTKKGYEQSKGLGTRILPNGRHEDVIASSRTSSNTWCSEGCMEDDITQVVLSRLENLTSIPDSNTEFLQLLHYDVSQFYKHHHDYIDHHIDRPPGVRIMTIFLYLNDVEEGGGTQFTDLNITVQSKRGKALLWPNVLNENPNEKDPRTEHEALPVIRGVKYGANAWYHQRDFKGPYKEGCSD